MRPPAGLAHCCCINWWDKCVACLGDILSDVFQLLIHLLMFFMIFADITVEWVRKRSIGDTCLTNTSKYSDSSDNDTYVGSKIYSKNWAFGCSKAKFYRSLLSTNVRRNVYIRQSNNKVKYFFHYLLYFSLMSNIAVGLFKHRIFTKLIHHSTSFYIIYTTSLLPVFAIQDVLNYEIAIEFQIPNHMVAPSSILLSVIIFLLLPWRHSI